MRIRSKEMSIDLNRLSWAGCIMSDLKGGISGNVVIIVCCMEKKRERNQETDVQITNVPANP